MKVTAETLKAISVFQDLDIKQRQRLAESMSMTKFGPGQQVITQDDDASDVFFIVGGQVRATLFSTAGKEVSFQDLASGEMFGELSAIDGEPRSTHVVTLEETLIVSMSQDVFWSALFRYPAVTRRTLERLAGLVRSHCQRIFEYSTLGVKNRIHAELLRLAREASELGGEVVIDDPPTHVELANRVATHREAVTRECKRMESLGIIEWRPGRHVIRDVAALERMVKEVQGR